MRKNYFMKSINIILMLLVMMFSCAQPADVGSNNSNQQTNENQGNQNGENTGGDNNEDNKPANPQALTLQQIINDTNAGEEIDLSKYKDVTDYNATINKKLTIKNGNLDGAKLTVNVENVKLEKIEKVSVSTSSRLTITNSKLSSLLIGGSGETSRSTTSDLETSLAMVSVTGCEIADVQLKGFNSQLNITDTATKIADILTSTKSKIILEAGSYDGMKDPVVEDNGELTRIDMTKDKELSILSIYSNPKKAEYKLNEEIDLTGLIVMGTYTASVEIFKSGGWKGEAIESVTKWEDEKDYSVSPYNFGTAGVQIVTIKSKSADVECNFYVYVVDDSQNSGTSQPEKEEIKVTDVKVKILGTPKTSYKVGEKLDLSCYQVVGTYSGFEINLPYTSDPANGTVLSEAGENIEIKFYYNDKIVETKEITVRRPCTVEFYDGIGSSELVCKTEVAFGESLKLPVAPSKTGYTFDGWYIGDEKVTSEKIVEEDLKLYATWKANTYTVKFDSNGGIGAMTDKTFTYDVAKELTANTFSRTGYIFAGWAESAGGDVVYADKESVKNLKSENNATITLYAQWTANTYTVIFNTNGGNGNMDDMSFTYDEPQTLTTNDFTRDGYTFAGWATSKDGNVVYADKKNVKNLTAENNVTVTLYAVWEETPTYSGGIEIEGNKGVTFWLNNEKASTGLITFSVKSGNTPLALTNAPTITVYNHGDVAPSTPPLTQNTDGTYSFTIPETFPKDETYQFVVSCNYESITYTDTFTVKLSQ
ncbi:MAG: InlB B-repeat-containing protein [Spirochaetales bacterium]|nr:InlB B-repeat-containing protein [Spirochaetales bacterium]